MPMRECSKEQYEKAIVDAKKIRSGKFDVTVREYFHEVSTTIKTPCGCQMIARKTTNKDGTETVYEKFDRY